MGAEPWDYFVPYEKSIDEALAKLRQREFAAGRFRGSEMEPATIEEAFDNMDADGTASILDMVQVGEERDFGTVAPLSKAELVQFFGTDQPTRAMVEANPALFEDIGRGQGVYVICYKDGKPSEIIFGGYSFD